MVRHDLEITRLSRPYDPTDTSSLDHPGQFERRHPHDQDALLSWVHDNVVPTTRGRPSRGYRSFHGTSYGLKHLAETHLGHYVSNGDMKGAMLAAGYEPIDPVVRNWRWRIRLVSSSAENEGGDRQRTRGIAC